MKVVIALAIILVLYLGICSLVCGMLGTNRYDDDEPSIKP